MAAIAIAGCMGSHASSGPDPRIDELYQRYGRPTVICESSGDMSRLYEYEKRPTEFRWPRSTIRFIYGDSGKTIVSSPSLPIRERDMNKEDRERLASFKSPDGTH